MGTVLAALGVLGALGVLAGCGGADEPTRPAPPPPTPPGFEAVAGEHYTFARPRDWQAIPTSGKQAEGKEILGFQSPGEGTGGLPSQVGLGLNRAYRDPLAKAVSLAKDENQIVYPEYEVLAERSVTVAGGEAYRIDAEYSSFTEAPVRVKTVDLLVQTPDRVQLNFFVRGPAEDFDRLRLPEILDSFRLR